jgi:hypothetical protein
MLTAPKHEFADARRAEYRSCSAHVINTFANLLGQAVGDENLDIRLAAVTAIKQVSVSFTY